MSNPAPILNVSGRVHAVLDRVVEPMPARPEERDPDTGQLVREAYPAREGYTVVDVTVLTAEGGFSTVSILPAALEHTGGETPKPGDELDNYPVRPFVSWQRRGSRSFPTVGLSLAGDVLAARKAREHSKTMPGGSRVASVPASA
jgi:hypothetical protein